MDDGTFPFEVDSTERKQKKPPKIQVQAKDMKEKLPIEKIIRKPNNDKTPLIYRGGKSSIATWVISYFPPHHTFVDVFGGGAAISLAKNPSALDVYNDIGDVSRFFEVLRDYGDEVYSFLTFYPFSREAFKHAVKQKKVMEATVFQSWDVPGYEGANRYYKIRWASYYYITILQSFRHEEEDESWIVSKGVNLASSFASHVDAFPETIDRLRSVVIEHKDYREILTQYDSKDTLFYLDPPYLPQTWESGNAYKHEMSYQEHEYMLDHLATLKGQFVVSGYPSALYDGMLVDNLKCQRFEKTRLQGLKNSNQEGSDRTEVVWRKVDHNDLWTQTNVSRVLSGETNV